MLPSSLLQVYVQYKQDTRAIIAWLVSNAPSKHQCSSHLSVRDLIGITDSMRSKAVEMPDIIGFHFRQAIAARSKLSNIFRKTADQHAPDTENHEFFTSSLTKIYADLCDCCARPHLDCRNLDGRHRQVGEDRNCPNRFATLESTCPDQEEPPERGDWEQISAKVEMAQHENEQPGADVPTSLADDDLGRAFELHQVVQEVADLLETARGIWTQVAQNETSLVAASLMTNVIFVALEGLESRFAQDCNISDPKNLRESYEKIAKIAREDVDRAPSATHAVESLHDCWHQILRLKGEGPARSSASLPKKSLPAHITLRKGQSLTASDNDCLRVMLLSIAKCIRSPCLQNTIIRLGTPVYAELGYLLTQAGNPCNNFHASSGVLLLLEVYQSYAFALQPTHSPSEPRLRALRFAQAAIQAIGTVLADPTMPCRCPGTLAHHLAALQNDLTTYLHHKQFDLFLQSPWVSGSHLLEMQHALQHHGLRLLAYRNYIGTVAHVYNALRLPPIPLLEAICTAFADRLFPGGRPLQNFKACYLRYMGCRLRFHSRGSSRHQRHHHHQSGCHTLAIPAHHARSTAGLSHEQQEKDARFDCGKTALSWRIKEDGYHVGDDTWDRAFACEAGSASSSSSSPKTTHKRNKSGRRLCPHSHLPPCDRLTHLHRTLDAELTGAFPVAKVNVFQVYLSCAKIVSAISDRYHGADAEAGQYCLCFADVLLAAADRAGAVMGHKGLVEICKGVITAELGGRGREEFLWGGV